MLGTFSFSGIIKISIVLILVGVIRIIGNVGSPGADVEATFVGVVDTALKRSLVDGLCQAPQN